MQIPRIPGAAATWNARRSTGGGRKDLALANASGASTLSGALNAARRCSMLNGWPGRARRAARLATRHSRRPRGDLEPRAPIPRYARRSLFSNGQDGGGERGRDGASAIDPIAI